jgi:hypothetical protein
VNSKTPAEQQLDILKRLKAQQKLGRATPRSLPVAASAPSSPDAAAAAPRSIRAARKHVAGHRIPLSAKAWESLRRQALSQGTLKLNQDLGDWVVELLLNLPPELRSLPEAAREDLFRKVRTWLQERGGS